MSPTINITDLLMTNHPADRSFWSRWKYEPETLVLALYDDAGNWRWDVDLEDCVDADGILRKILEFAGRAWARQEDISGLVYALKDCFGLHGGLYSFDAIRDAKTLRKVVETNLDGDWSKAAALRRGEAL